MTRRPVSVGRLAGILALAALAAAPGAASQEVDVSGYALGVGTHAGASTLIAGGTGLIGRFRLMPVVAFDDVVLEAAYEHVLTRTAEGGGVSITTPGGAARSTDWLDLGGTVRQTERTTWRHRFDRLALSWQPGAFEITLGRQAISWATTLFLTPADPFSPFDPSDPFREYRGGVDAVRIRTFPGPFSELELVVRGADTPFGATTTALLRGQTSLGGGSWSVGGWGGALHDEAAAAAFLTGSVGSTAVRAEASLRDDPEGGVALRSSVGVDRYFRPGDRDLFLVLEFQHDEFGTTRTSNLLEVANSKAAVRGDLQTLGTNSVAVQVSYQLHPLTSVSALGLANVDDGSGLLSLSVGWSASGSVSVSAGGFLGIGDDAVDRHLGTLGSEYGLVPGIGYVSMSWFF